VNKRNSLNIYTNLYPNADENNFTDFRFNRQIASSILFNVSAYYRLWHDTFSSKDSTETVKPSILDLSGKFGFKVGPVRIGPTFGLHAILDYEADEIFKRDGNLYRLGGTVEGLLRLPYQINVSFRTTYEHGFVYNEELTVVSSTGELIAGELQERHPTTFQFSSTISAPIVDDLEFVGRINYYKINSDMDETLSINPIEKTTQMSLQIGVRYIYN
jgi:hypothetical protein